MTGLAEAQARTDARLDRLTERAVADTNARLDRLAALIEQHVTEGHHRSRDRASLQHPASSALKRRMLNKD